MIKPPLKLLNNNRNIFFGNTHVLGFTLLELLITLSIVTILLVITAIGMGNIASKYSADKEIKQLYVAINYARSEAIKT
ncbi:MAG: prepilin-type N-terminal cleavage/methylation domain-containing protein, partial [Gammaproteobacteria bacterium]|nr:prepilin-type N-terminal cleavage/methylation domain-containing protein [Gammaproteobacteria bacterium]